MMLRKTAPTSSMQKTYDECYLNCSTAIYFEGLNNESEALRQWRNALDQIYYHNAYKMPSNWQPRTETEKALQDSLRAMELQCKERVDLLEALEKSRKEAEEEAKSGSDGPSKSSESVAATNKPANGEGTSWLGGNTVPQASYTDIPKLPKLPERRPVAPPARPSYTRVKSSSSEAPRAKSMVDTSAPNLAPPGPVEARDRTPSPEKKAGGMLKTLRSNPKERTSSSSKLATTLRNRPPPAAAKAATQVWAAPQGRMSTSNVSGANGGAGDATTWDPYTRTLVDRPTTAEPTLRSKRRTSGGSFATPQSPIERTQNPSSGEQRDNWGRPGTYLAPYPDYPVSNPMRQAAFARSEESLETAKPPSPPPPPPPHRQEPETTPEKPQPTPRSLAQVGPSSISYMKEYPNHPPMNPKKAPPIPAKRGEKRHEADGSVTPSSRRTVQAKPSPSVPRKSVGSSRASGTASAVGERRMPDGNRSQQGGSLHPDAQFSQTDDTSSGPESAPARPTKRRVEANSSATRVTPPTSDDSDDDEESSMTKEEREWSNKVKHVMKNLPKGVDEAAAKQIFNEIVIKGDEVHWDDVAGLEPAKSALKETVVYPFLRPDLFMGLREPARGMLLFGPPGTGKTMLARAVATESKSVFFAISASSLTSKYLGESEKLVRALFSLAKQLAPSIIFVDEIDSLLGARGGGSEHEATRRIKTEFLIQWSDLQKAAAGREDKDGDATRVLVLAATNLPWAIDEAARRRFVRRQYIPLPEDFVREQQLRKLLSAQKHSLRDRDLKVLVLLTEDYSGSDITALAKDAAMGPLRSLGEKLLHMSPEDIRPIGMEDFEASLVNIRPSVGKQGLKEFEDWARDFGERGG